MSIIRQKKYPWYWFIFLSLAISVSASEEDDHFLDASLEEILSIPLDTNAVNIQESHIHKEGEWMVGYRYMYMSMAGNLDGENSISQRDILKKYAMTPLSMDMEMHMGSLMYAPSVMSH